MTRRVLLLAVLVPAVALAFKPVESGKPIAPGNGVFAVQPPQGWLYDTSRSTITATRDGVSLDSIAVEIVPHKKAFKDAKKTSTPTTPPEDLAESYIADLQAGQGALHDVVVISTDPAELAGKPAFRVVLKFRAPESAGGAEIEMCTVGTALADGVMLAIFRAPAIHFFDAHVAEFDAAVKTIELLPPKK
jgi:hypothetical protein